MDVSSWLRRNFLRNNHTTTANSDQNPRRNAQQQLDDQILGLTDQLIDLVNSFTLDTFKNFPLSGTFSCLDGQKFFTTLEQGLFTSFRSNLATRFEIMDLCVCVDYQQTTCGGDDSPTTSENVRNDLSEWQQRHATLVLSKVKTLSQLRYRLCPGYLKEDEFWRVYFSLVKSHVAQYELQAIRLAKIKEMALENGKSADKNACEVEMAETKSSVKLPLPTP